MSTKRRRQICSGVRVANRPISVLPAVFLSFTFKLEGDSCQCCKSPLHQPHSSSPPFNMTYYCLFRRTVLLAVCRHLINCWVLFLFLCYCRDVDISSDPKHRVTWWLSRYYCSCSKIFQCLLYQNNSHQHRHCHISQALLGCLCGCCFTLIQMV